MPTVLKSGSLILLEPSGTVQACNGIALLLRYFKTLLKTNRKLMACKYTNITLSFCRYVGICAGIKIIALALFLVDWWLVRRRNQLEEQATMTVGDLVGSIISLDKCKLHIK